MTGDRWGLPTAFFSVVVKRAAVNRSFPGGVGEFERVHGSLQKNGALFLLPLMSMSDVEYVLGQLNDLGVIPGQDVGVVDMMRGPLLACPGLLFENVSDDEFVPRWMVTVDRQFDEPARKFHGAKASAPPALTADSKEVSGPLPKRVVGSLIWWVGAHDEHDAKVGDETRGSAFRPSVSDPNWHPLISRYGYAGGIDHLCARQTPQGVELAVCGHRWLADVPMDWFDEDGVPLPERRDEDGGLKLPSSWEGEPVTGIEDDVLVGELLADDDRTILLDIDPTDSLAQALDKLRWDGADLEQVQSRLQRWDGASAEP